LFKEDVIINRIITLGLIFVILNSACGKKDKINNSDNDVIMPLTIGNEWQGVLKTFTISGTMISEIPWTYRLDTKKEINNISWFEMKYIVNDTETVNSNLLFTNRDDGLWARLNCDTSTCPTELWAKYPAVKYDTFFTVNDTFPNAVVISTDTTINIPLGEYSCYAYRWYTPGGFNDYNVYYLTINLGLIRKELFSPGPDDKPFLAESWELENINIE
jgi:hypothetical protein